MSLTSLHIMNLRNIASAEIDCSPQFNLFFGNNAAGKTSVLEAVYYLSTGKSFRTHHHDRVIQNNNNELTLFARFELQDINNAIGVRRTRDGSIQIRVNEETIRSIADISRQLPIQFIGSDSHRILSDGPKCRRQFLDWGLFHTNFHFFACWKTFQKLLVQRNAALKARASFDEILIWNHEFALAAEKLNGFYHAYLADFLPFFNEIISTLLPDVTISFNYSAGWDQAVSLEAHLKQHVSRETMVGHSLYGPQRADLALSVGELPAQDALSQGQQKLVSYALRLAQGLHLHSFTGKTPIYLIDDLPSELDSEKRTLVTQILANLGAQAFITGIEAADLDEIRALNDNNRMFHVKHGVISEFMPEKCFT